MHGTGRASTEQLEDPWMTRADRRPRRAWTLCPGDYVHDGIAPMRVTGWDAGQLLGVTARGVAVRATHPPELLLDVTRLVDTDLTQEHDMTPAPGPNLAFIALNTTGPSTEFNEIWEMSVRLLTPAGRALEAHWQLPVIGLPRADAQRLQRTRFYDRYVRPEHPVDIDPELGTTRPSSFEEVAEALARHLVSAHPVSLAPEAELPHLSTFLRRFGQPPFWLEAVPVTALAAGVLMGYSQGWNDHTDAVAAAATGAQEVPGALRKPTTSWPGPPPWTPMALAARMLPGAADDVTAPGRLALTVALWEAIHRGRPQQAPSGDTLVAPA